MTIREIANLAGVSSAAVSRYFNDGYISEEKRKAIKKVVEETGYRPSLQASTLRTKKARTIGVIIPKTNSSSTGLVLSGAMSVIEANNYRMLLAISQLDPKKEIEYLNVFDESQVDGIILLETMRSQIMTNKLKNLKVPIVVVGQHSGNVSCAYHDDRGAMKAMTELMISKGRRDICYIGVTRQDKAVGEERISGYQEALKEAEIPYQEKRVAIGDFSIDSGYEAMVCLLETNKNIDAVVCATDKLAVGAKKAIEERGLKIPRDIMVSGQGDSELAANVTPSITTIHYHYRECGVKAANVIFDLMSNATHQTEKLKFGFSIVEHDSTRTDI